MLKKIRILACLLLFSALGVMAQVSIPPPLNGPASVATPSDTPSHVVEMPRVSPEKVVLTVGDIHLTAAQFDAIVEIIPDKFRDAARGTGRKAFAENLVKVMVLAEEGKRRKLNDTQVFKTQEEFQTLNHLAADAFAEIADHAPIDEATLRSYYEEHKADFEQVHARHILVRCQGSIAPIKPGQQDLTEAEALAKAERLRKQLLAGADFSTLAEKESDDAVSAAKGGEIETFGRGQLVPEFEKAAFSLEIGVISEPVRTPFGYHLIEVESRGPKPLNEIKPEMERRLRPQVGKQLVDDLQRKTTVVFDPEFFGPPSTQHGTH